MTNLTGRDICFHTMNELALMIKRLEITPSEVTEAFIQRIEKNDGLVNSYVQIFKDEAREAARIADQSIRSNRYIGPLHGIPIALKDVFDVAGHPTTYGSKVFLNDTVQLDGSVVKRLRDSGAVILGKLNLDELAFGVTGESSYFGPCRNPWNLERISGGSSAGAAAAVAASFCVASVGTDAGGSVRLPASLCGIVGLKPTYGLVSRYGAGGNNWSLDHVGPMTKTVADCATMLQAISGPDPRDVTTLGANAQDLTKALTTDVKGMKIGVQKDFFYENLDKDVEIATTKAVDMLKELGANILEISVPWARYSRSVNLVIGYCEAASNHEDNLGKRAMEYGDYVRGRLELGKFFLATHYLKAQRIRSAMTQDLVREMSKVDAIVTPTTPITATKIGDHAVRLGERTVDPRLVISVFTSLFNLTGFPAISIPCGFTSEGMPIGLQIAGKPFDDAIVIRVAHAYETNTEWHKMRPPI